MPLTIYMLDEGGLTTFKLGRNISAGELPQIVIPAGKWFGAKLEHDRQLYTRRLYRGTGI